MLAVSTGPSFEVLRTWLRMNQAARRLGVSLVMVRKYIEQGRLEAIRTPYGHLVDPESVERLAREREERRRQGA